MQEADPFGLLQWGVLGIVLLALLTGWIWAKPSVDMITKDKDALRAENEQLRRKTELLETEIRPALEKVLLELERLRGSMRGFSAISEHDMTRIYDALRRLDDIKRPDESK